MSKLVGTLKLGAVFEKIIFQVTQKSSLHFEKVLVAKFVVKFVQKLTEDADTAFWERLFQAFVTLVEKKCFLMPVASWIWSFLS